MFRLVLALAGIIVVLSVAFGVVTLRHRASFRDYKATTVGSEPRPWDERVMSVSACVEHTVDWAMACPGLESWCSNEAPQLTRACLESADRSAYCREVGDEVSSTKFGYHACERMREAIEGRYAKRSHKKFCAASYRAVAEHCRRHRG